MLRIDISAFLASVYFGNPPLVDAEIRGYVLVFVAARQHALYDGYFRD